jgi:uncharacterized protein (TIGR03435 family)
MVRGGWSIRIAGMRAAGWVAALTICVAALLAQMPGTSGDAAAAVPTKLPEWDVVSVKRAEPGKCPGPEGSGLMLPKDGVHIFCLSPQLVIELAYGIPEPSRILGVPVWEKSGGWNIDAKVAGEDVAALGKLSRDDRNRMLQALLADRFHLKAHIEKREMPVYDLVLAKSGSKLKEATAEEASQAMLLGAVPGKIKCVSMPLSTLPPYLNRELGRPMLDKTGLTGKYDFTLEFVPAAKAGSDETGGPSIFTAIEEQLGLKLEPAKEPMDVLVIDSIEQPAAN